MSLRNRLAVVLLPVFFLLTALSVEAQSPIALPYTNLTMTGLAPMSATVGTQCPNLPTGVVSTSAYGDGCLAVNAILGLAERGGVQVDSFGNVFIDDDIKGVVHMINQSSGIMTVVAGTNTVCAVGTAGAAGKLDASGDGCVAATATPSITGARGSGIDPYGNILLAGYSDHLIHMICRNASPLCSASTPTAANPVQIAIGTMGLVAGCAYGTGSAGSAVTAPTDNVAGVSVNVASPYYYATGYTNTGSGSCATMGGVDAPRGATADVYGNVYYGDSGTDRFRVVLGPLSYNGVTNPMYAIVNKVSGWTATPGFVYTIANSATAATTIGSCTSGSGASTDTYGDGCLFTNASVAANTSYVQGMATDAAGNLIFTDQGRGVRVLYVSDGTDTGLSSTAAAAGARMKAVLALNGITSPVRGYTYMLVYSTGTTTISSTPTLGNSTNITTQTADVKVTVSPQGNIYIGDSSSVMFLDMNTGYVRLLLTAGSNVAAGTVCNTNTTQVSLSAYSDGCPAANAAFGNGNGLGVAVDTQGNLYVQDSVSEVHKILAQGLAEQTVNTTLIQTMEVHLPESVVNPVSGAVGAVTGATATVSSTPDITAATPSCTQNADYSVDCTVAVTSKPTAAGMRSATLTVTLPAGAWTNTAATISLGGKVTGTVMAVDAATMGGTAITPTTTTVMSGITPVGLALDGAGNVYTVDGNTGFIYESVQGAAKVKIGALGSYSSKGQIAVDQLGDVFIANSALSTITELKVNGAPASAGGPLTYLQTTIPVTTTSGTPSLVAVAVDSVGNLFVADATTQTVYRLNQTSGAIINETTVASGFTGLTSLAVDGLGNVYIADYSGNTGYKYAPGVTGNYASAGTITTTYPYGVAVDAANDIYVQDLKSGSLLMYPVSGTSPVTVYSESSSPNGVAVDGQGNVFIADDTNSKIVELTRDAVVCNYGTQLTAGVTACASTLTNIGTAATTGSNVPGYFTLSGCGVSSNEIEALAAGQSCSLSATISGTATTPITFLPTATTVGSLTLEGILSAATYNTATTISGASTTTYLASGTEATYTISVAPASGSGYTGSNSPGGTPTAWVCSGTTACASSAAYVTLSPSALAQSGTTTTATSTVTVSGLPAGTYNINAYYAGGSTTGPVYNSSATTTPAALSVGQITTNVNWTLTPATQLVSAALSASTSSTVLNATETPAIAGNFVYTATCTTTSGNAACAAYSGTTVDGSTYLPIGTYNLSVTFYPNDLTDYATSTGSVTGYTVTQATAIPAVGASTSVVSTDGTANYTSLTTALSALPVTGGTIYLKPGYYYGQNAISYPNVQLRGLGGDPTKVVLTAEHGAFSAATGFVGTGIYSGNAAANGDQGSSTLDVTKSTYMGTTAGSTQYTPNNFYAEYLTVQNTYNTDTVNTTLYNTSSGSCATSLPNGVSTAQTMQYWYNAGYQCSSQALALWIESDAAIMNNVNLISQQDTLYSGSQGCGSYCTTARQYYWKGLIVGDVDYIFGDSALVLDHTNIFTTWHGNSATGTETIEAQNKKNQTGSSSDYLSGYVCNSCTLMSQSTGMTALYYGRPYGPYSTWIMLNNLVDQVNAVGWIEFSGDTNLPTSTYAEYNTQAFTDPAVGTSPYPAGLFYQNSTVIPNISGLSNYSVTAGYTLIPAGGSLGSGITGTRETTSTNIGTIEASNAIRTTLTAAQAAQYYPVNFLNTTLNSNILSSGQSTTWNPVSALAAQVNAFVPTASVGTLAPGASVTILGRPQTPGAGMIPTGTYAFYDSLNSNTVCTTASAGCTSLASGSLDASGEAYLTTSTLASGTHYITMVYNPGSDPNFVGGSSTTAYPITVASLPATTTALVVNNPTTSYGTAITGSVTVASSGSTLTSLSSETVTLKSGATTLGTCTLSSGTCNFSLTTVAIASSGTMTAVYAGDSNYSGSTSTGVAFSVGQDTSFISLTVPTPTVTYGTAITGTANVTPTAAYGGTVSLYLDGSGTAATTCTLSSGSCTWTLSSTLAAGSYSLTAAYAGDINDISSTTTGSTTLTVNAAAAAAVATGDTRTVTEPVIPTTINTKLLAAITEVGNDIPTTVDATTSNPDGARIQAALNACTGSSSANCVVELSASGSYNAFLSGPLSMPSYVTLLVDPGVTLFFSRNVQDYDKVSGTHTCGTINNNSATNECLPLIDIPKASLNVSIMGYGKLDGRGGDPLLNGFATSGYTAPSTYTWWNLASQANNDSGGNQQNPRFIQLESSSSSSTVRNLTLYKITLLNSPMFHISTMGTFQGFTAWDIKIVTPSSARNTDGIDPGNATNFTINKSWISDGDDNVAVGASGTGTSNASANISVTNNRFFAGHGESIGSYTSAGVSNVLFDGNMSAGNGFTGLGAAKLGGQDGNSTAVRIKSANDRGGAESGIQYSNSCFANHSTDIQFTPFYEGTSTTGTETPNFNNILLQNLIFENDGSSTGTMQFTGAVNGTTTYPLTVTMDNVSYPSALAAGYFVTTGTKGTETNAQLTYGPGAVSSNFKTAWASFAGSNGDTVTDNSSGTVAPPTCTFTYLAPELTGPAGVTQSISQGNAATIDVILTPAMTLAGTTGTTVTYPTGTVTLTDALTSSTYTGTLSGTSDTLAIPVTGLSVGTHTFSAKYTGDSNYTIPASLQSFGSYVVTVTAATTTSTTSVLSLSAATAAYGTATATATVTGSATASPSGNVEFFVNGSLYGTVGVSSTSSTTATATLSINEPVSGTAYTIYAVYMGDALNATSTTASKTLTVTQATPTVTWTPAAQSLSYGAALSTLTAPTAAYGSTNLTNAGSFTYTATPTGGTATAVTGSTVLAGGTYTLTATFIPTDTTDYVSTATGSVSLTVSAVMPTVTWTPVTATVSYGATLSSLSAPSAAYGSTSLTTLGSFTYTSTPNGSSTATALTSSTVLNAGIYTLTATFIPNSANNTDYTSTATASITLTVNAVTPTVTWTPTTATVSYGATLSALSAPTAAFGSTSLTSLGSFTYTSTPNGSSTATALTNSTVLNAGIYTLTATFTPNSANSADYTSTGTASITLTVNAVTPTVTWTPTTATISYGSTLSALSAPSAAFGSTSLTSLGSFTYTSTPNGSSTATALTSSTVLNAGTYTLTATFVPNSANSTDYTSTGTANVTLTVSPATPTVSWTPTTASISYGSTLSSLSAPSAAFGSTSLTTLGSFTYTSTPNGSSTATALTSSTVLNAGTYTLTATFIPNSANSTNYASTGAASIILTVNPLTPTVVLAPPTAITYGTLLSSTQLSATATSGTTNLSSLGSFSYTATLSGTSTATPVAIGTLLPAGTYTLTATFVPGSTNNSNFTSTGSASVTLVVSKVTPSIAWATPTAITYGTALSSTQLNPTSSVSSGTWSYSPASGTVLTAGTQTLTATFTPTDSNDYNPAAGTVQLTVNKVTTTVTWPTPAAITYGTALSSTQLNATANTAGTWVYSPALGTVSAVGNQTLKVTFTPTDSTDYSTPAQVSIVLVVNPETPTVTVTSNSNPVLLGSAVAFTATVSSSTSGTPTGTVTFLNGTTTLGTASLSKGAATYSYTPLTAGTYTITASYGGDTDDAATTSTTALSQSVVSVTIGAPTTGSGSTGTGTGSTQSVTPGGTAAFSLPILPSSGTSTSFPVLMGMCVTGLPTGSVATVTPSAWALTTATFTPACTGTLWTLPANTPLGGNTLLSIKLPPATEASNGTGSKMLLAPLSLALLLLPFAGRMRRTSKRMVRLMSLLLLLAAGIAATTGLTGCGGGAGYFSVAPQTYAVTVSVNPTGGTAAQAATTTLSITVQ